MSLPPLPPPPPQEIECIDLDWFLATRNCFIFPTLYFRENYCVYKLTFSVW
jgi:hypothetical protein